MQFTHAHIRGVQAALRCMQFIQILLVEIVSYLRFECIHSLNGHLPFCLKESDPRNVGNQNWSFSRSVQHGPFAAAASVTALACWWWAFNESIGTAPRLYLSLNRIVELSELVGTLRNVRACYSLDSKRGTNETFSPLCLQQRCHGSLGLDLEKLGWPILYTHANATYCTDLMVLESIWIALGHLCMYIFYLHHNVHLCFVARSIPVSCQEKLRQLRHLLVVHMGQNPVARIEISRAPLDIRKTAPLWPLFTEFHGLKLFHSYFSGPLL